MQDHIKRMFFTFRDQFLFAVGFCVGITLDVRMTVSVTGTGHTTSALITKKARKYTRGVRNVRRDQKINGPRAAWTRPIEACCAFSRQCCASSGHMQPGIAMITQPRRLALVPRRRLASHSYAAPGAATAASSSPSSTISPVSDKVQKDCKRCGVRCVAGASAQSHFR